MFNSFAQFIHAIHSRRWGALVHQRGIPPHPSLPEGVQIPGVVGGGSTPRIFPPMTRKARAEEGVWDPPPPAERGSQTPSSPHPSLSHTSLGVLQPTPRCRCSSMQPRACRSSARTPRANPCRTASGRPRTSSSALSRKVSLFWYHCFPYLCKSYLVFKFNTWW